MTAEQFIARHDLRTRADLADLPGWDNLEVDSSGNPCVWRNLYENGRAYWVSYWSCQCEDDGVSPYHSEWVGPEDPVQQEVWDLLPEKD